MIDESEEEAVPVARIGKRPEFAGFRAMMRADPKRALQWLFIGGSAPNYFRPPVRWLFGRDLRASLGSIALYSAFGDELDHRDWMHCEPIDLTQELQEEGGFWFDYVADTGDGQLAMYDIAALLVSDVYATELETGAAVSFKPRAGEKDNDSKRLPRGRFLFMGGDTAYHVSDAATLASRICAPFRWAEDERHRDDERAHSAGPHWVFGVPGNHDYYDSLIGFNRIMRAPNNRRVPIADFQRRQSASFVALQLPFDYLFLGLDSQKGKLDHRQRLFMRRCLKKSGTRRLIVATPEPTTVFEAVDREAVRPFNALKLERPFQSTPRFPDEATLHLDLAGDVHHYARYSDPAHPNYASVVAGGGGAFFHPTHTTRRAPATAKRPAWPPSAAALYPSPETSRGVITARLLCPWRILRGGGVFPIGGLFSLLLYIGVAFAPGMHEVSSRVSPALSWRYSSGAHSLQQVMNRPASSTTRVSPAPVTPQAEFALVAERSTFALLLCFLLWAVRSSTSLFAAATERDERKRPRIFASRYIPLIIGALGTLGCMGVTYYMRVSTGDLPPQPFYATYLLLFYLAPLPLSGLWTVRYLATLPKQAKVRRLQSLDYVPRWLALGFGAGSALFGALSYGVNSVAAFAGDLGAIGALLAVLIAPSLLATAQGQGRALKYRVGYAAIGGVFGVLQLCVPLGLALFGNTGWLLASLACAIGLSALAERGYRRWPSGWFLLGMWLLAGLTSAALPLMAAVTGALQQVDSASCTLAFMAGGAFACVWFGFYLAVALAFNAHNNEAGGAARSDYYRHFVRFKVEPNRITGYVIGFDRPAIQLTGNGPDALKPKLVDVFTVSAR